MTNLSPVATATGFPNDMSVIDSLKRLERVGSENSKTTEKLLMAAAELSKTIVEMFGPLDQRERVKVCDTPGRSTRGKHLVTVVNASEAEKAEAEKLIHFGYEIGEHKLLCTYNGRYVAENREEALAFSRDIAAGLLDYIIPVLEKRNRDASEALEIIQRAAQKLKQTK